MSRLLTTVAECENILKPVNTSFEVSISILFILVAEFIKLFPRIFTNALMNMLPSMGSLERKTPRNRGPPVQTLR